MNRTGDTVAVVIGRNEGERLRNCLASLQGEVQRIVYVDSGSTDDSVACAQSFGASVHELDPSQPFSAARARNAGIAQAMRKDPPAFIQLLDGDCMLEKGWIRLASETLKSRPDVGIVTGWRAEIFPEKSIYNALCDFEWHRPAGEIETCGGDMLVRAEIAERVRFDPSVIAAEDDEFCIRVRGSGAKIVRLPVQMSRHDADMTRFSQWWQRAVRSGHGFAQVGYMHPDYFQKERQRLIIFGGVLPVLAAISAVAAPPLLWIVLALYGFSYTRTTLGLHRAGLIPSKALSQAVFLTLSKFPNLQGMAYFFWRRLNRQRTRIIEYK